MLFVLGLLAVSCGGDLDNPSDTATSSSKPPEQGKEQRVALDQQVPPAEIAPPPDRCNPDDNPEMHRLSELDPPAPAETKVGVALRWTLVNSREQVFTVTLTAPNEELIDAIVRETSVCLEAQAFVIPPEIPGPPSLTDIVISTIEDMSGKSQQELAQVAATDSAGDFPTLRDVATDVGVDPAAVVTDARDTATQVFSDDPGLLEAAIIDILDQPDATALLDPTEPPADDAAYAALLAQPADIVIVDVDLVDPQLAELPPKDEKSGGVPVAVAYVIDPGVNLDYPPTVQYYRAKCQWSAYVRLHADAGRMTVKFWRRAPYDLTIGYRYASTTWDADPTGMWHSSAALRSYDIEVKGWKNGSWYHVDGSWTLGWGGLC